MFVIKNVVWSSAARAPKPLDPHAAHASGNRRRYAAVLLVMCKLNFMCERGGHEGSDHQTLKHRFFFSFNCKIIDTHSSFSQSGAARLGKNKTQADGD